MSEEQKKLLEKQLWGVANVLRGKMNADEYKNYILGFIFYKYLSEKLERYVNEKLLAREKFTFAEIRENTKEGKTYLEHIKTGCIGHLGFFLKPIELFSYLVKKGKGEIKDQTTFILEDLKKVLNTIEQTSMGTASEDDFKGLFDDVDLTSTKLGSRENQKNEVVVEVLALLSGIDFKLEDAKSDLLGDAYEYLIGEFAAGAGKKGGEFYTPAQVSRLLAQIVSQDKKRLRSVYDPTCGSGSLLLRIGDYTEVVSYFGQELNPTTYNLARMNMILHGVHFDHFKILQGDTLTEDMHADLKAEAIVANPPFSAEWKGEKDPQLAHDDRFSQYGRLAPKSAADYAFVTHMLYHLADNGTMAVVLPHGALFRSGAEGQIRKYIIEKQNYLDAVIGLPSNLFYGTSIPATVLVFKKCRRDNEDILFIDASKGFEKVGNQNRLTDENIKKIFDTYKTRKEIEKYSHRASIDEIKENEYNLNIPRYVDTFEEEEVVDIDAVAKNLKMLHTEEVGLQKKIAEFCEELGIGKPF
ncbi:MAG: type I restriction-modification system subunit M [Candidatus Taylorbacteria bacterium CG11_big_fil_rev_8_21_14_0_20_46_11]|uniref:site-specific DNA-methyltransferase (adenine-specific) n=1 Tax=Candidatus Taylorbacteria bacterium CG11_big_fil_rev_8_21_14_0_20_46_11 TaxID=1975025 RepID=A0A2H0KAJ0_9BACT|nr:MAG: type I restriction-modification system subunit M [Candidatus Taylorbacteria bacterium CG11_big_fil_rev_8_21_14_0_20_46_11]